MKKPYKHNTNYESNWYVDGPGNGLGYYSQTLWPSLVCGSKEEAIRAADIANEAYKQGYLKAQSDIRKALGVEVKK